MNDQSQGSPIRVAHVIGKLNAAGVEAVINNYYRNINHERYQFDFYIDADGACDPPQELIDMGARYIVVPPYQKLPQYIAFLTKCFREKGYSIVHSSMNTLSPISLYCAWRAGVPIRINHNHSTAGKGETKKNIFKYLLRPFSKCFATHYAACSRYAGEWLFGKKMVESGRVSIFNNAIDIDRFRFNPDVRSRVRIELGLKDCFVIGHVGRFCYQKNQERLIEIFQEIYNADKNARLLLIGIGETQEDVQLMVCKRGLKDVVMFLGARNDVNRLYQAMDVFVFPSRYEGLGLAAVEAEAAGLPCVLSTKVPADAAILPETQILDLDESTQNWAEAVLKTKTYPRRDTSDAVRKHGFDIVQEAKKMELFYDYLLRHKT